MDLAPKLTQSLQAACESAAAVLGIAAEFAPCEATWSPAPSATVLAAAMPEPFAGRVYLVVEGAGDAAAAMDAVLASLSAELSIEITDAAPGELPSPLTVAVGMTGDAGSVTVAYCAAVSAPVKAAATEALRRLNDVEMTVTAELGRARLTVRDILEMVPGKVVELDRIAGGPIDLLVNGKLVARGEVVVIDEEFGVRVTEIVGDEA